MKVKTVYLNENGGGRLFLVDRYGKEIVLDFDQSFEEVTFLNGQTVSLTPVALYFQHRLIATRMNDGIRVSDKIRWTINSFEGICIG
jgi:hypothetical protein